MLLYHSYKNEVNLNKANTKNCSKKFYAKTYVQVAVSEERFSELQANHSFNGNAKRD